MTGNDHILESRQNLERTNVYSSNSQKISYFICFCLFPQYEYFFLQLWKNLIIAHKSTVRTDSHIKAIEIYVLVANTL